MINRTRPQIAIATGITADNGRPPPRAGVAGAPVSVPRDRDRGVSPVVGVILMVAVTVVLAAVLGTFVLDLGGVAASRPPMASIGVDADSVADVLVLHHRGGDRLDSSRTRIVVQNGSDGGTSVWPPTASRSLLVVGGTARVNLSTGRVDWNGDRTPDYPATGGDVHGLAPRTAYTVLLVDVPSGRVIAEAHVMA